MWSTEVAQACHSNFSTAKYFSFGVLYRLIQEHSIHKLERGVTDLAAVSFLFVPHPPAEGQRSAACCEPDSTEGVATTGRAGSQLGLTGCHGNSTLQKMVA